MADSPFVLDAVLTLANGADRGCRCQSRSVVSAFMAFAEVGLLPDPGISWESKVAAHNDPLACSEDRSEHVFTGLGELDMDDPHDGLDAVQAVFESAEGSAQIGRWTIAATLLLLIDMEQLPAFRPKWHNELKRLFETSQRAWSDSHVFGEGMLCDV